LGRLHPHMSPKIPLCQSASLTSPLWNTASGVLRKGVFQARNRYFDKKREDRFPPYSPPGAPPDSAFGGELLLYLPHLGEFLGFPPPPMREVIGLLLHPCLAAKSYFPIKMAAAQQTYRSHPPPRDPPWGGVWTSRQGISLTFDLRPNLAS
jgi:hypothetical protein